MKWLKRIVLGLALVVFLLFGVLYGWSTLVIGKTYPADQRTVLLTDDPAVIREGERLARAWGCFHGCHGADMEGDVFFEARFVGRFVAPNLTAAVDRYTPGELEAIIRQGVRPDGTSVLGMPSEAFSVMTDEDLSAVLSFISSYPKKHAELGDTQVGPLARLGLVMGEFWVAAAKTHPQPWKKNSLEDPLKLGEYLAITTCSECHGPDLQGQEGFTPPLLMVKAYSATDFSKLMATGVGLGERDLGLMSEAAAFRFSHLKPNEVEALYAYLHSL